MKKSYKITRIGNGWDSPEPPRSGSNPAGAILFALIPYGFSRQFEALFNGCSTAESFSPQALVRVAVSSPC
jgi:hypothetical protein